MALVPSEGGHASVAHFATCKRKLFALKFRRKCVAKHGETTAEAGDPPWEPWHFPINFWMVGIRPCWFTLRGVQKIIKHDSRKNVCVGIIDSAWQQNATNLSPHTWLPIKQALYDSMLDWLSYRRHHFKKNASFLPCRCCWRKRVSIRYTSDC